MGFEGDLGVRALGTTGLVDVLPVITRMGKWEDPAKIEPKTTSVREVRSRFLNMLPDLRSTHLQYKFHARDRTINVPSPVAS